MERALWDHVPSICKVRPRACGDVLDSRKDVSPVKERQPPIEFRRWCASIRSSQRAEGCIASAEIILVLNGKADLHAGTHVRSLVLGAETEGRGGWAKPVLIRTRTGWDAGIIEEKSV